MKSAMSAAAARRIALSCTAVGFRSNFTVAAASAAAGPATDSMQSSTAADVEAVWRLFMAWSSPGNDHQAQILHCACNLSPLQRNLPEKPGWPLAAQSAELGRAHV